MPVSSQGHTWTGLPSGLTNVKVQYSAPDVSARKVDASTLDLTDGAYKVYVNAPLIDAGPAATEGVTVTISVSYLTDTPPTSGSTASITVGGHSATFLCVKADVEYAVGELVKGTAEYTSMPS